METLDELEARRQRHRPPAAGSEAEARAIERFLRFFSDFSPAKVETLLADTYADDVYFNDTLKAVRGLGPLRHYLAESAAAVEHCHVEVLDVSRTREDEHLLRWRMLIRFRRFKRGQDTWTVGMSHLRFDAGGRVAYHQDYWNAADGLYRHIPVLGWMIAAIQRKL